MSFHHPRRWVTAIVLAAAFAAGALAGQVGFAGAGSGSARAVAATAESNILFINLQSGYEDLHRVNMALSMARNQNAAGRPVTLFLNINAPILATKRLSASWKWGMSAPIKTQMAELIGKGVKVLVCPMCSADQGVAAGDLVAGAQVSNPELVGSQLQPGTVTMTY